MQFGKIYLKTGGGTKPYVAFKTPKFCSCVYVLGRTHIAPNSLTLHKPVSVVSSVKSFYLARGWSLSSLSRIQNARWGRVFIGVGWLCLS